MSEREVIDVTAAIIERDGLVLIARRKAGKHLAGKWEFPGGKVESGESHEACLERELFEELGVAAECKDFVSENLHKYPDKNVRLHAYTVEIGRGVVKLIDHDQIEWVNPQELLSFDLAEADVPLVRAYLEFKSTPITVSGD